MSRTFNYRDVITPKPGLVVRGPSYWICKDGDPKKALFYGGSPQCNANKSVVEYLLKTNSIYKDLKDVQIVFVELSFK